MAKKKDIQRLQQMSSYSFKKNGYKEDVSVSWMEWVILISLALFVALK